MDFVGATVVRSSVKAICVQHPDLVSDIWVPRKAISVLSALSPFTTVRAGGLRRGNLTVEGWYASFPQCQEALAARQRRQARAATAVTNRIAGETLAAPAFVPSPDQEREIEKILTAMAEAPRPEAGPLVLLLNGPAGSGKTACVREIARRALEQRLVNVVQYGAPTGRAALRMRESGCACARTIHSLFYKDITEDEKTGEAHFTEPKSPVQGGGLLVTDEASMIGKEGLHVMLMASMPAGSILLYVGDRAQLEPVKDVWGADFDHPTGTLETIHRQAAGSPILQVATAIRTTGRWSDAQVAPGGGATYIHPSKEHDLVEWYAERRQAGQDVAMVAATHALRHALNKLTRERLGLADHGTLTVGDRLLVRRNNHDLGVMNGQQLNVTAVDRFDSLAALEEAAGGAAAPEGAEDDPLLAAVYYRVRVAEFGNPDWWLVIPEHLLSADNNAWWKWRKAARDAQRQMPREADYAEGEFDAFLRDLVRWKWVQLILDRAVPVNYGECMTCHAAQGSQWASVGVAVCGMLRSKAKREREELDRLGAWATDDDRKRLRFFQRWLYTAVTRAAQELCVFNIKGWEGAFNE